MASPAETPFNTLLHADADVTLPALVAYVYKKSKSLVNVEARLDLLAGLLWLHTHAHDVAQALLAVSDEKQLRLAAALRLNFLRDGKFDAWPTLLSRRILANGLETLTLEARRRRFGAASADAPSRRRGP